MSKVYPSQREELKEDDADASTDNTRGEQQSSIRSSSTPPNSTRQQMNEDDQTRSFTAHGPGAVARKHSNRNMLLDEEQDPEQEQQKASVKSGHRKADCDPPGRREEGPCFKDQARSFAAQVPGAVAKKNNGRTTEAERDPEESKEELDHERVAASSRLETGPSFKDQSRRFAAQVPGAVRHGNHRGKAGPSRSQLPSSATEGPDFKDQVRDHATSAGSTTPGASIQRTVPSVKDRIQSQPSPGASSVVKALQFDDDDWSGIEDNLNLVEAQVVDERRVYLAESVEDGVLLNRRRLCIVVVVMLGIVAAIVGGVCGSGNCSSSDDVSKPVTTTQPQCTATAPRVDFDTTSERYLALRGLFSFVFGPEGFEDESEDNPRFWALHWLANVDEMELAIDSSQVDRLAQRYVLVLLYYSTAGWCWSKQINWLSAQSECRWETTSCVDEPTTIREIRMISNNLNGTLPSELGVLTNLTLLDFASNHLSGTIPTEFGNLYKLGDLSLGGNLLTGPIPTEFGNLIDLSFLALTANMLNRTLPSEFGKMVSLEYLYMARNQLTGMLPSEIGSLPLLQKFHFHDNQFLGDLENLLCEGDDFRNGTEFVDIIADCLDEEDLVCNCCSVCCNATTCCEKTDNGPMCSVRDSKGR